MDTVRDARTGEVCRVTATYSQELRFTWEHGWEMRRHDGTDWSDWEPYRKPED